MTYISIRYTNSDGKRFSVEIEELVDIDMHVKTVKIWAGDCWLEVSNEYLEELEIGTPNGTVEVGP